MQKSLVKIKILREVTKKMNFTRFYKIVTFVGINL